MNRVYLLWNLACAVPVLYGQTVSDIIVEQVGKNVPAGHHTTTVWDVLAESKCVLPRLNLSECF